MSVKQLFDGSFVLLLHEKHLNISVHIPAK